MRILVWDTGYYADWAIMLARRGIQVDYYVDWVAPHPELMDWAPGYGFKEIRKLKTLDADLGEYDLILFPDVGFGGLADSLRSEGLNVVGAGEGGEKLELDREYMHNVMVHLGISRPETRIVKGADAVAQAVDELGGGFIKISTWRGNFETFYAETGEGAKHLLEESGLGPLKDELTFIVEGKVEGVEIGCDCVFNGREFLKPYQYGIEVKDKMNVSIFTDYSPWDTVLDKIAPFLAETGYRGFISFEGILTEDGDIKLLDVTARLPFPAGGLYANVSNLEDVLLAVGRGETIRLEYATRCGVEIVIATELVDKWLPLSIEGGLDGLMLKYAVKVGENYYHVPAPVIAGALGFADSTKEAYDKAVENAERVKCSKCFSGSDAWSEYEVNSAVIEAYM